MHEKRACLSDQIISEQAQLQKGGKIMADKVILTCTECLSRNYVTEKNKKTHLQRLEIKKYCPKCKKHTLHKETK